MYVIIHTVCICTDLWQCVYCTPILELFLCMSQDVTGAYYVTASLGKPSVLDAHLTLCPEGIKKETELELDSGCMGKGSGSVMCKTTPLGLAVLLDDVKLMEMLLAKGASPNDCSDSGERAGSIIGLFIWYHYYSMDYASSGIPLMLLVVLNAASMLAAFSALHLAVMMKKEKTLKLLSKQAPIEPLPVSRWCVM